MKLKRIISLLLAVITLLVFSVGSFADVNVGSDDGAGFGAGTSDNFWGVKTDSGVSINSAEGLRITVYDSTTETKVFNTIDITGNPNISAVTNMRFFADTLSGGGYELVPKTSWLSSSYIGSTYNNLSTYNIAKYTNAITSRIKFGSYPVQYVSSLASLTIISENNTAHLEELKEAVGSENFLRNLCDLISGLNYSDFVAGKYKIAFEPVAYFRYAGNNWAMTATEVGIYNNYFKNTKDSTWNSTNNLRATMGTLTHSELPRAAFLETKDLGIPKYSPTDSDYYNGNTSYNSDLCIIRCMGIGTIGNSGDDEIDDEGEDAAEYHTDTEVYTSWTFQNTGDTPILDIEGDNYVTTFNIRNDDGELPAKAKVPSGNQYLVDYSMSYKRDEEGHITGATPSFTYAYDSEDVDKIERVSADSKVKVFIANTVGINEYNEKVAEYDEKGLDTDTISIPKPYVLLGSYKDGDTININKKYLDFGDSDSDEEDDDYYSSSEEGFRYTVTTSSGTVITSGTVTFACPANEEAMGWFKWKTPKVAQKITITITSLNSAVKIVDSDGNLRRKLVITAKTEKVEEVTPPDPQVTDTRPSWWKNYSTASAQKSVSGYASKNGSSTLSWYTWSYSAGSNWTQNGYYSTNSKGERSKSSFYVITEFRSGYFQGTYTMGFGSKYEKCYYYPYYYGVDNREYSNGRATLLSGSAYSGAVIIELDFSGENNGMEKTEYTVSLEADVTVTPSSHCYTATYNSTTGKYTMKSGYGVQIAVTTNLTGDTGECTDAQQVNTMFSEFNYNKQTTAKYNRLLEKVGGVYVFKQNEYSTYKDRVHFTPIWYPDNTPYRIYTEVFDVWCPAGQLSVRIVDDSIKIKGNVYDDWHVAAVKP